MVYADRTAAGHVLGLSLDNLQAVHPLVLGLPRGGVAVAAAVQAVIGGQLDILLVRKVGVPRQPELAVGAVGEGGVRVVNPDVMRYAGISSPQLTAIEARELTELHRRRHVLRGSADPIPLAGRTVVIVDDGMATGATVVVACRVARLHQPDRVVVAVPVSSTEAMRRVAPEADAVICPWVPRSLHGVGGAYRDFHQLTDAEVLALLS
ncbi:phosphoribosyltransferase [Nocardia sp. CNY236]|uniref:phosphoribosyltransferase n=1 Tax=Nocardia sp. CNY236 TaxID=1169152 RepID=UPI0004287CCA|nr:phosphoribosyltransferase family protein [Nocardia sp. CNY236]